MCELKYSIKRVPFTCPYNNEEWKVIIMQNVKNKINNYKSMFKYEYNLLSTSGNKKRIL